MDHKIVFNSYNAKLIRVLACVGVVLTHLGGVITSNKILLGFFGFGAEGVRVFFLLSGFLMCSSGDLRNGRVGKYYKKRLVRILPIYYVTIVVYICLSLAGTLQAPLDETGLYWSRYLLLLSTSIPNKEDFWTNLGGTWTISYFMLFYLLAPFFYKFLKRWSGCMYSAIGALMIGVLLPHGILEPIKGLYAFILGMALYRAIEENKIMETITVNLILGLAFNIMGIAYPYGDTYLLAALILTVIVAKKDYRLPGTDHVVNFIDKHSYAIYLIHLLVIEVLSISDIIHGKLFALAVVILTAIISWALDSIIHDIGYLFKKLRRGTV